MSVGYKDFFPTILKSGYFSTEYETLSATLDRANHWITESGIRIINVETVVLPNVQKVEDASQVGLRTSGEMSSYWRQILRVWYEAPPPT